MKLGKLWYLTALGLSTVLAVPQQIAAQEKTHSHNQPRRYRLIDTGTLGGPTSSLGFEGERDINNQGVLVSLADTSLPDPYAPDCFLDCFLAHMVVWKHGVLADMGALPVTNNSGPTWISDEGLVSGLSQNGVIDPLTGFPEFRAVLWKHGSVSDLGTFGGNNSCPGAVNERGQVVGGAATSTSDPFSLCFGPQQTRAFLWQNGSKHDLGTLGGPDAIAFYVNEHGQVAGFSYTNSTPNPVVPPFQPGLPTAHPFLWTPAAGMKDLGTIGGTAVFEVNHLSNRGQVVGGMTTAGDQTVHPFLWDGREMGDLGTLGGSFGNAIRVNDAGEVVGLATPSGDQVVHAFRWRRGVMADLGVAAGNQCSVAYDINSRGMIVGSSDDCAGNNGNALLWDHGDLVNLNIFVPANSGLRLTVALNINERGAIAAQGVLSDGDTHAFVLIPCESERSGEEGCEDEGELTTATNQGNPESSRQNPLGVMNVRLTPEEIAARMRARFGRNLGKTPWVQK